MQLLMSTIRKVGDVFLRFARLQIWCLEWVNFNEDNGQRIVTPLAFICAYCA